MTEVIWPGFFTERSEIEKAQWWEEAKHCLAFGFCEASKARAHKLAKARGCFLKDPDNIFCHVRKLAPDKFQMRQFI